VVGACRHAPQKVDGWQAVTVHREAEPHIRNQSL
jgi:hypothetical protein